MSPHSHTIRQRMVRLRRRFAVRGGALYLAGETVSLAESIAAEAVDSGAGEYIEAPATVHAEEEPAMPAQPIKRGPGRPPKDKMIHGAPVAKGGR